MAPARIALPRLRIGIDRDRMAALVGHSSIHRRGGEAPGGFAGGSDGDEAALAPERPDVRKHGIKRLLKRLAADADAFCELVGGNGADEILPGSRRRHSG